MKRFLLGLMIACTSLCHADTCPSLDTIKHQTTTGWKILDAIDGTPLAGHRVKDFLNLTQNFLLAEWVAKGKHSGEIHCYYGDKDGSNLEAYLEKDKYFPLNQKHLWYTVTDNLHCAAGIENCMFRPTKLS